jgi:nucleoside-diphosphate-sugar epimerase
VPTRRPPPAPPLPQALKSEPLTLFGDGKQTRSFQYVSDLIEGMVRVMDNEEHIGPFNIGNPGARRRRGAARPRSSCRRTCRRVLFGV